MTRPNYRQIEISKLIRSVDRQKRKCIIQGCNYDSINSHLLQRNGILKSISVDGHLIERKLIDPNKFIPRGHPFEFKRVGLKNAFSLSLLCNKHDSKIFQPIENLNVNYKDYQTQILLSYRIILAEIRKKEIALDKFRALLNSKVLEGKFDRLPISSTITGFEYGINDLKLLKKLLELEFDKENGDFVFRHFEYPLIKIYASAVFSPSKIFSLKSTDPNIPYEQIFIHIIPLEKTVLVICGYHKDYQNRFVRKYVKSWGNLNYKNLGIRLTKLFCDRIENWGLSPEVFDQISPEKIKKFNIQAKSTIYFPAIFSSSLNIFQNY